MKSLTETFDTAEELGIIPAIIEPDIKKNLKFELRDYQIKAINRFNYYINDYPKRLQPAHLYFHMATGSGKTLVMAANILQLYKKGYRNFVFITTLENILIKTKENFINKSPENYKYLFSDFINIEGGEVEIKEVNNFKNTSDSDINIYFTSIHGLHSKMKQPSEYGLSEDDFVNKDIVMIMDESHHINVETKNNNKLKIINNWESTIGQLLEANPMNFLIEYSATMDLNNKQIAEKYKNKRICDYSLKEFRRDRYSKEIKTNQNTSEPVDRIITAIIISQYKKKVFAHNKIPVKPVILAKSKIKIESLENKKNFIEKIKNLNEDDIIKLRNQKNDLLIKAFNYFDDLNTNNLNLITEIKNDFSLKKIISIDTDHESEKNQILINTLEQENNPIRLIFAVDKLNEGWDVLNLFDIVRLYNTRDASKNIPGQTTIREAQLIGRGARYYPFEYNNEDKFKRKFDNDLENEMRICETLHYHCSYNPRYIDELKVALKQIGIIEEERHEINLKLKTSFKSSSLYQKGFLYCNKKISSEDVELFEEPKDFNRIFEYEIMESFGLETTLFEEKIEKPKKFNIKRKKIKISEIKKHIIIKALSSNSFYYFNNIKKYFPKLESINDFLEHNYLGSGELIIRASENRINQINDIDLYNAIKAYLQKITEEIIQNYGDFQGTKVFYRLPFRKIFKDKILFAKEGSLKPDTELNVNNLEWYAYEENFGSSEEKFLVRFINDIVDTIKEKYKNFYLVRNERFFKIYRFSDGKAFEPDYVMFLNKEDDSITTALQLFIEPKGEPYLAMDDWKEKFLLSIDDNKQFEHKGLELKVVGLPFYNETIKKKEFEKAFFAALKS